MHVFDAAVNFNFDGTLFPLPLFLAVLSLRHFAWQRMVSTLMRNTRCVSIMPFYGCFLSCLLYYPVINTGVSRVITTNASASWNKRQFFSFIEVHIISHISRTYCDIFYHAPHNTAYFYQEKLPVREETWPCYSQSVPSLTEYVRCAAPLISLYQRFIITRPAYDLWQRATIKYHQLVWYSTFLITHKLYNSPRFLI